ncbi:hypothetical protein AALB53_08990 [Lachnospiraceae bacterium 47-T17]
MCKTEKRIEAEKILTMEKLSTDQKLFLVSQLYKEELMKNFPELNCAFLAWKDSHLQELRSSKTIDCLERFKDRN